MGVLRRSCKNRESCQQYNFRSRRSSPTNGFPITSWGVCACVGGLMIHWERGGVWGTTYREFMRERGGGWGTNTPFTCRESRCVYDFSADNNKRRGSGADREGFIRDTEVVDKRIVGHLPLTSYHRRGVPR